MVSIGPLALSSTVAVSFLSAICMFVVAAYLDRRHQLGLERWLWWILLGALGVGRLVFVVQYWDDYKQNLWGVANIRDGGFHLVAALSVLLVALAYQAYQHKPWRRALAQLVGVSFVFSVFTASLAAYFFPAPQQINTDTLRLTQLQGQPVDLDAFTDKPLVLNLWASWCPPCRAEMPIMAEAQKRHPDLHFVFVNQGESIQVITQFLQSQNLELEHVLSDSQSTLLHSIQARALPTTLFINTQGQVVDMRMGELSQASLAAHIKRLR